MTRERIKTVEKAWGILKNGLRNEDREEVIKLDNGARLVYYPPKSLSKEKGHKNMHCKVYKLVSPSGALVEVTDLAAFCKDFFGVNPSGSPKFSSSFYELASGVRKQKDVNGWTLYNEESA